MRTQVANAKEWCMKQEVAACITGSCLLDYFENQDIDLFAYSISAFNELLYAMKHNDMFILADPKEQWKFDKWTKSKDYRNELHYGMISIKFKYNLCVDINLIYKSNSKSLFDVLSSFDMDIICKGYDLSSKKYLDLTDGSTISKIADWNKWNKQFKEITPWSLSRLLRQFKRIIKYHNRGYNTDLVCKKYKSILEGMLKYVDIFKTEKTKEKAKGTKEKSKILINIFDKWLELHSLTEEEGLLLDETIKNI